MDGAQQIYDRLWQLERAVAELRQSLAERDARIEELRQTLTERDARIEELEAQLRQRGKNYRPKPNRKKTAAANKDRRKNPHREHDGQAAGRDGP